MGSLRDCCSRGACFRRPRLSCGRFSTPIWSFRKRAKNLLAEQFERLRAASLLGPLCRDYKSRVGSAFPFRQPLVAFQAGIDAPMRPCVKSVESCSSRKLSFPSESDTCAALLSPSAQSLVRRRAALSGPRSHSRTLPPVRTVAAAARTDSPNNALASEFRNLKSPLARYPRPATVPPPIPY